MLNTKALAASASAPPVFVDDVFSTYLYTGNGSTQTITNGIDVSGEGGLVWVKGRNESFYHRLASSPGPSLPNYLASNATDAASSGNGNISAFTSSGFTVDNNGGTGGTNSSGINYCSWTFRKAPKFFDVVTYTGNGAGNRTISHSLGSTPGMIVLRAFTSASSWWVYHRSLASKNMLFLNLTSQAVDYSPDTMVGNPTSTTFDVSSSFNSSGETYVAYLFAHDAGGFGAAGTDNVISCGSYTGTGSLQTIDLGYEPQFIITKRTDGSTGGLANWVMVDTMRGVGTDAFSGGTLNANTSDAEIAGNSYPRITATGFNISVTSGHTFIYMAIRRPMKPPTSGTEVFKPSAVTIPNSGNPVTVTTDFPVDLSLSQWRGGYGCISADRLRGGNISNGVVLQTWSTSAESTSIYGTAFDSNTGIKNLYNENVITYGDYAWWNFRRATGFFDVVCYTGTGTATTVTHNLGAVPELMIVKRRNTSGTSWFTYSSATGNTNALLLDTTDAAFSATAWNNTTPTSSVFSLGTSAGVNGSGSTYVAYLFATVAGVSKVGSYTGNGSTQTINCGFTAGARFVMVKATSTTGDWVVVDTARGLVSGNDPFLQLNSTAAEVTGEDILDPDSSGFVVNQTTESINASGVSYIFLAIA